MSPIDNPKETRPDAASASDTSLLTRIEEQKPIDCNALEHLSLANKLSQNIDHMKELSKNDPIWQEKGMIKKRLAKELGHAPSEDELTQTLWRRKVTIELRAAVGAADNALKNKDLSPQAVFTKLKELSQSGENKDALKAYASLYYTQATSRLCLGSWLANAYRGDEDKRKEAHELAKEAKKHFDDLDQKIASDPKLSKLLEELREPLSKGIEQTTEQSRELAWYEKAWEYSKDMGKEAVCDVAAITAGTVVGIGAGIAASETVIGAPIAAVAAGVATGSATYTGMKTLVYGDKFTWDMPIWGALDGLPLGTGTVARLGGGELLKLGGKLLTKEGTKVAAEEATKAAGKKIFQLGVKEELTGTAKALNEARIILKEGAQETSRLTRFASHIPGTGYLRLGDATYRQSINEVRKLALKDTVEKVPLNFITGAGAAVPYELSRTGRDYFNGTIGPDGRPIYSDGFTAASDFGKNVFKDGTRFVTIGAFGSGFMPGALTSTAINGTGNYFSGRYDSIPRWSLATGQDVLTNWGTSLVPLGVSKLASDKLGAVGNTFIAAELPAAYNYFAPSIWSPYDDNYIDPSVIKNRINPLPLDDYQAQYYQFLDNSGLIDKDSLF